MGLLELCLQQSVAAQPQDSAASTTSFETMNHQDAAGSPFPVITQGVDMGSVGKNVYNWKVLKIGL